MAQEPVSARKFANKAGLLDKNATYSYYLFKKEIPASEILIPGQFKVSDEKVEEAVGDYYTTLVSDLGHGPPFTWQELDQRIPPAPSKQEAEDAKPGWQKIDYVTKQMVSDEGKTKLGALQVRRNTSEAAKALKDATGAKIGFSDNRLQTGDGAWNSEGALIYPMVFEWDRGSSEPDGSSLWTQLAPAVYWHLAETQDSTGKTKDVQELKLSVPVAFSYVPPARRRQGPYVPGPAPASNSAMTIVTQLEPYYDTDFSLTHQIWGTTVSLEYVGKVGPLHLGGFVGLFDTNPESTEAGDLFMYSLRLRPLFDYSQTERGGPYTKRVAGDDWSRVGAEASLDFRFGGGKSPLDIGVSYRFLQAVSGTGGFSDLLKPHVTWWVSPNTALTLEYQRGETPVADQDIDLISLGLEFKY